MSAIERRRFVQAVSGGFVVGLAGCIGGDEEPEDDEDGAEPDDPDDEGSDEQDAGDGEPQEGLLYAFAPDGVSIVDPEEGEVVDEITEGIDEQDWADPRITSDLGRIFTIAAATAQVAVIDTAAGELEDWVDIGPDATHIYHPNDDEVWAHSDDEGSFYVIDTDSLEVIDVVEAGLTGEGHGKLLYHEDLGETGYATNVTDAAVPVIDIDEHERTDEIDLDGEGGTHYKAYAPETGLAYFERAGEPGGTTVIDTETNEVVDQLDFGGGMYLSPDEEVMAVLDGEEVHFFGATSEDSEVVGTVEVEGEPGALRYHEADDTLYAFTANTTTPDVAVIDVESGEAVGRIDTGEVDGEYRAGVTDGEYFVTPADADGTVAIINMASQERHAEVEVAEGVDTVQYVSDSGVGYTGT